MSASPLRVVAVGDLSFNGQYHSLLKRRGSDFPFRAVAPLWSEADLRLGNLESPVTASPRFAPDKCTLRAPALALDSLKGARLNCVSLANNHMMDFGPAGLRDTCRQLSDAGIAHTGAGEIDSQALAPAVLMVRGETVGILAFCDVVQISPLYAGPTSPGVAAGRPEICVERIRALRSQVDWLLVLMHWGTEMAQLPSPAQRVWARQMVEAGADLILGHHPHVLQPMETIDGVPVFYSLGNFLFSEMRWRGQNTTNGDRFVGMLRIPELCRQTGWAEVFLHPGRSAKAILHHARLSRNLKVEPDETIQRQEDWDALGNQLLSDDYAAAFDVESDLARMRLQRVDASRPLLRRVENLLYRCRLLPRALEG